MTQAKGFHVWRPGQLSYRDAFLFQEQQVAARHHNAHDLLMLLEHPPVITLGRNSDQQHLCWDRDRLAGAGIECVTSNRGGDVTLHNPGQLVGYPIVDLAPLGRDLHCYLRMIEDVLIKTLAEFDLNGLTVPDRTGVWIEDRKIASIGIAVRRWVAWHGFALNVENNLTQFEAIVPCGLEGVRMTSMSRELERAVSVDEVGDVVVESFAKVFGEPCLGEYSCGT